MNVRGDGRDVWPYTGPDERCRFDVSKLDQWEVVFDHMDRHGMMLARPADGDGEREPLRI